MKVILMNEVHAFTQRCTEVSASVYVPLSVSVYVPLSVSVSIYVPVSVCLRLYLSLSVSASVSLPLSLLPSSLCPCCDPVTVLASPLKAQGSTLHFYRLCLPAW